MIYDQIQNDIKEAMKAKDNLKRDCLRSIVSEIKNQTVNAGKELTEDVCIKVLQKSVKMHNDSISQFKSANRTELAEKEENELKILESYLPKMMSELEMQTVILKIICDNKIPEVKKSMGLIMKHLNELPDKNRIDRKYASSYLNVLLK